MYSRWPAMKRMMSYSSSGNLPALIDSLNGAERLRYIFNDNFFYA